MKYIFVIEDNETINKIKKINIISGDEEIITYE